MLAILDYLPQWLAVLVVSRDVLIVIAFILSYLLTQPVTINPLMGVLTGLKAFVAAVVGGIGNIPGAMLGGLLLGLFNSLAAGYISTTWQEAITFALLIAILLVRPTGILGERVAEMV